MADITFELSFTNFTAIGEQMAREADAVCEEIANKVATDYKLAVMSPPKSGREYKRGKRTHQASAPGEAPASDLGNLVNSVVIIHDGLADWSDHVTAEYALALEIGTPKILPRPAMRPAVEGQRANFTDKLNKIVGN